MDKKLREIQRDFPPKETAEHEQALWEFERAGYHVHNTVTFGAVKFCRDCSQRWEVAGTLGNYYWESV